MVVTQSLWASLKNDIADRQDKLKCLTLTVLESPWRLTKIKVETSDH